MPAIPATILIPDISGYTDFMNSTELDHSIHVINQLLDSIIQSVGNEFEVSEIEGDAVLLYKKGDASTKKELVSFCMKIFNAFHFQRLWLQQTNICACGACQSIINLRLKFIAHFGPVSELKVSRFTKLTGLDMIVAHRLLKNSIVSDEYLLLSEKLLQNVPDHSETLQMEWSSSADEFASIGKINYEFVLLGGYREKIQGPPPLDNQYFTDDTTFIEIDVNSNFHDIYLVLNDIRYRAEWVQGLKRVEQEIDEVYIGNVHQCIFDKFVANVSPLRMEFSDDGIIYAETCQMEKLNLSTVYEYVFKRINESSCRFGARILPAKGTTIPDELKSMLMNDLRASMLNLKKICEANNVEVARNLKPV